MVFFLALGVFSCDNSVKQSEPTFRCALTGTYTSADPILASTQANSQVVFQLFRGLTQLDDSLEVQPCIAKSWVVGDSARNYVFTLDSRFRFHDDQCFADGQSPKVTAADVVYSIERLLDAKSGSRGRWVLEGKLKVVKALNDSMVSFQLVKPVASFLKLLAIPYCSIVSKQAVEVYGNREFGNHPVGCGPFRYVGGIVGQKLILRRSKHFSLTKRQGYAMAKAGNVEVIEMRLNATKQNEIFAFLSDQVDVVSSLEPSFFRLFLQSDQKLLPNYATHYHLQRLPFLNTEYIGINLLHKDNQAAILPEVLQALSAAINREELVNTLRFGLGRPAYGWLAPPELLPKGVEPKYDFSQHNMVAALELMKGVRRKIGLDNISIELSTNETYLDQIQFLQKQWYRIGVATKINVLPNATLSSQRANGELACFRGSWIADYPALDNYFALIMSDQVVPAGSNYCGIISPAIDSAAMHIAEYGPDRAYVTKLLQSTAVAPAIIPLFYDETMRLISNKIDFIPGDALNRIDISRVILKN